MSHILVVWKFPNATSRQQNEKEIYEKRGKMELIWFMLFFLLSGFLNSTTTLQSLAQLQGELNLLIHALAFFGVISHIFPLGARKKNRKI